ncbi:MAG TPA: hypothetical protein VIK86_06445 [Candidatus Paceibacterota bacterium]
MKNRKTIVIAILLLIVMFAGCSKSTVSTNGKSEKLVLTKENIQKVFSEEYDVTIKALDSKNESVDASFTTKEDITKDKAKEKLKEIEDTLQKKFGVINKKNCFIVIYSNEKTVVSDYYGKIQMGEVPTIDIKNSYYNYSYSIANKFNLLNPFEDTQLTAKDKEDGDITSKIKLKNPEILTKIGQQTLIYEVTDSDDNIVTNNIKIEITK